MATTLPGFNIDSSPKSNNSSPFSSRQVSIWKNRERSDLPLLKGYSQMMVKVGETTLPVIPKAWAKPLANCVLPEPSSPCRAKTKHFDLSTLSCFLKICRAISRVSSSDPEIRVFLELALIFISPRRKTRGSFRVVSTTVEGGL